MHGNTRSHTTKAKHGKKGQSVVEYLLCRLSLFAQEIFMKNELILAGAAVVLSACATAEGHPIPAPRIPPSNGVRIVKPTPQNELGERIFGLANGRIDIGSGQFMHADVQVDGQSISLECSTGTKDSLRAMRGSIVVYEVKVTPPFQPRDGLGGVTGNENAAQYCSDKGAEELSRKLRDLLHVNSAPPVSRAYTQRWRRGRSA